MKILHLSDLHLGKRLGEFPLFEEQRDILKKIISAADDEKPDIVVIAGDVYNRAVPQEEAVRIFDDFLYELSQRELTTFIISGNHDSADRIAFGGRIMSRRGIHLSPVYNGTAEPVTLSDEHGEVDVYMLPFIKPVSVKIFFTNDEISTYNDAVKAAVSAMDIDKSRRNILITHQFITGAELSESEEILVGGTENVDASVFADFDYVALGHIHHPQTIGKKLRYCGTPMKYSLSECTQEKSLTIAELGKKGELSIRTLPIAPMRDVKEYRGTFEKLTDKAFYENINTDDYVFITLTDDRDIPEAVRKLRKIYPRMVKMRYDNLRTQTRSVFSSERRSENVHPEDLFCDFYENQNNHSMSAEQTAYIRELIKSVWEEDLV